MRIKADDDEPEESPPPSDDDSVGPEGSPLPSDLESDPDDTFLDVFSDDDECESCWSFNTQDDRIYFDEPDEDVETWFSDDFEGDDCSGMAVESVSEVVDPVSDVMSDPPETPPESPIGSFFDDDKLECMSYFSEDEKQPVSFPTEPDSAVTTVDSLTVATSEDLQSLGPKRSSAARLAEGCMAASEHPAYARYFKMLKVGLPAAAVKAKMLADGVDPSVLDAEPSREIPLVAAGGVKKASAVNLLFPAASVPLSSSAAAAAQPGPAASTVPGDDSSRGSGDRIPLMDHVTYGRYFKMLKFGFNVDTVRSKIGLDGFDPDVILRPPGEMVSAEPAQARAVPRGNTLAVLKAVKVAADTTTAAAVVPGVRRKTIRVKGVDAARIAAGDSLWAEEEEGAAVGGGEVGEEGRAMEGTRKGEVDLQLDQEEFNRLFIEKVTAPVVLAKKAAADQSDGTPEGGGVAKKQPKGVHLIDLKRAQNVAIALSRIKVPYEELCQRIAAFDDSSLSVDQLLSLSECLPTPEEGRQLSSYAGDVAVLGHAERYMVAMRACPAAQSRLRCLIYRQLFPGRQHDIREKLGVVEAACHDVRHSARLKRVLKIVLKVINHINGEGNAQAGITVDALLRLRETKAFDRKTTILQYVVMLIQRNDADALLFPSELEHIADASRLALSAVDSDRASLQAECDRHLATLKGCEESEPSEGLRGMLLFLEEKARHQCDELGKRFVRLRAKYSAVLGYFGEDPGLSSVDFFGTLVKFSGEFSATVEALERQRRAEARRAKAQSMKSCMSLKSVAASVITV